MRVLSVSGFSSYWGRHPVDVLDRKTGITVGGGEEAWIATAAGLAERGHAVTAYGYGERGVWRKVDFRTREDPLYPVIVTEDWDAICCWSCLDPLAFARQNGTARSKRLFVQQLNDLLAPGTWSNVDCVVSPSRDHADRIIKAWGWTGPRAVVHNGLDETTYIGAPSWAERPKDVGYWSSPDRGLHHLLRAWPLVVAEEPTAKLHIFYEIVKYLEMATGGIPIGYYGARGQEVAGLLRRALHDPSVAIHGAIPRRALAKFQKQCRVMCYSFDPVVSTEGFCGAINSGIAAGCLVMAKPEDALPSLYEGAVHWIEAKLGAPKADVDLAREIVAALRGQLKGQGAILAAAAKQAGRYTWTAAAVEMEAACNGISWF